MRSTAQLLCLLLPTTIAAAPGGPAGGSNAIAVCSNAPAFLLVDSLLGAPQPGGTWYAPNGNPHNPVFIPGVDASGSYCYVVSNDTACLDVSVSIAANAGMDAFVSICSTDPAVSYFSFLGGDPDPGGTWIQCGADIWCYVVVGQAPCTNDTARVTVNVVQAPDAGLNAIMSVCDNALPFILFDSIPGAPWSGGAWTFNGAPFNGVFIPGVNDPGVYCYAVQGIPPCGSSASCLTVTVLSAADPACGPLGLSERSETQLFLWPEPNNGALMIHWPGESAYRVSVLDIQGRMVLSHPMLSRGDRTSIDLSSVLHNGRYVLLLTTADGRSIRSPFTFVR